MALANIFGSLDGPLEGRSVRKQSVHIGHLSDTDTSSDALGTCPTCENHPFLFQTREDML